MVWSRFVFKIEGKRCRSRCLKENVIHRHSRSDHFLTKVMERKKGIAAKVIFGTHHLPTYPIVYRKKQCLAGVLTLEISPLRRLRLNYFKESAQTARRGPLLATCIVWPLALGTDAVTDHRQSQRKRCRSLAQTSVECKDINMPRITCTSTVLLKLF